MKFSALLILFALVGCSPLPIKNGIVYDLRGTLLLLNHGDSKSRVLEVLRNPGDRSFRNNHEAWQYCENLYPLDTVAVIWFENGLMTGLTTKQANCEHGRSWLEIDWGQIPADRTLDININK